MAACCVLQEEHRQAVHGDRHRVGHGPQSEHAGRRLSEWRKIRVMFDTGAAYSTLTRSAARRAGITPASAGVMNGGLWAGQVAKPETWIGPFASFKIGEEEIQNTRLRFADADLFADADMLIGVDFFLFWTGSTSRTASASSTSPTTAARCSTSEPRRRSRWRLRLRRKAQLRRRTYHPPIRRCPTRASISPTDAAPTYAPRRRCHGAQRLCARDRRPQPCQARPRRGQLLLRARHGACVQPRTRSRAG